MPSCQLWDATVRHHLDIPQLTSARAGRWDTASRTIDTGSKLVCNIALSSCGRFLAVCQLGGVQVWDMTKGDHFYMIEHGWAVRAMFSPDGRLIASSGHESGIMLWATTTGGTLQCVLKLEDDNRDDDSTCMAFSPDNRQIASGHSASVRLWDVATGALQHVIETQQGLDVVSIAFSPSSHVLAWGNLNTEIYVRAITTGMQRPLNENHDSYIRAVALVSRAPDPSMLDDPWPCDSDPPPLDYRDPNILLDPHGFVVEDWCVQQSTTSTLQSAMDQFRCTHSTVVCSTDSKTATANNPRNHHETLGGCGIEHRMTSNAPIVFLPKNAPADTSTACDSSNHTERQKRTTTTTTQRQDALGSSKSPVVLSSIALSSDGRFVASGSVDGMVQLWDAETHEHLRLIGHCYTRIYRVTFSNGGETVASLSTDCIVRTWDPTNSFQYHGLVGHDGPILCIALSPNGRSIISGSADHTVRAWDATTGAQQWVMTEHCRPVTRIVFSHDGRLVVSCSDTTRVHCVATGFHPPAGPVSYIASNYVEMVRFSPNDKYILSQHDARDLGIEISTSVLCVWDATTGIDVCYSARGSKRGTLNVLMAGQVRDPALTALVRAYWKDKSEPLSPTLPCDVDTIKYEEDGWVWRIRNGGSGAHQRVCWLPAERRGRAWVARGHMLWVGGESGAITALNLEHVQAFESPSLPESYSANRPPEFFEVPDRPMDD
jgi:WD40 repeat protein